MNLNTALRWFGPRSPRTVLSPPPPPPPPPPPGAPADFTATALGPTQIELSWTPPAEPSRTKTTVERSTNGGSTWTAYVQDVPTLTSETIDSCLAPDTTYTYRAFHRVQNAGTGIWEDGGYSNTDAAATTSLAAVGARALLTADDFQYLGFYEHDRDAQTAYAQGLTFRRVGGQARLLTFYWVGNNVGNQYQVEEYAVPGSFGASLGSRTNLWVDVWDGQYEPNSFHYVGLDWDEGSQRLWTTGALYYPQAPVSQSATTAISRCQLNSDGSISNFEGFWGFEGVGQRAIYGGTVRVPDWFATANLTGPYMHGFGGGHSLSAQGLYGAVGPFFVFPDYDISTDPGTAWADVTPTVAAADFRLGADARSGVPPQDYWSVGSFATRAFDRGCRVSPITNFLDDPNYPTNPSGFPAGTITAVANTTPVQITYASTVTSASELLATGRKITVTGTGLPALDGNQFTVTRVSETVVSLDGTTAAGAASAGQWYLSAPSTTAQWYSPAPGDPDGYGRMTWGDSYFNTGCWVDDDAGTRTRHGIVTVAALWSGKVSYIGSAGYCDTFCAELHVYDPAHVAECLAGTRDPFDVRPVAAVTLSLPGANSTEQSYYTTVRGACFDPTAGRLYVLGSQTGANGYYRSRIYVFQVRGS